jgi:hypothetical protein
MIVWYTTACQLTMVNVSGYFAVRSCLGEGEVFPAIEKQVLGIYKGTKGMFHILQYIEIGNQPHSKRTPVTHLMRGSVGPNA